MRAHRTVSRVLRGGPACANKPGARLVTLGFVQCASPNESARWVPVQTQSRRCFSQTSRLRAMNAAQAA